MIFLLLLSIFCSTYAICPGGSDAVRNFFLKAHNDIRSQIALGNYVVRGPNGPQAKPPATNMMQMDWDCSVEAAAQKLANQCSSGRKKRQIYYGQNYYTMWSPYKISDLTAAGNATASWIGQFNKYGWSGNIFYSALLGSIGSATQVVWAGSSKLGCAVKHCPSGTWADSVRIVCSYLPAGNYYNQEIYEPGSTCSNCPDESSCDHSTGLCVSEEMHNVASD